MSFICAGGRSPSDISNAAETRCDEGELSDAGIDIEPTPALVFLSYFSRTLSLLGNFKLVLHTSLTSRRTQILTEEIESIQTQRISDVIFCYLFLLQTYAGVLVVDRISSFCQTNTSRREFYQVHLISVNKPLHVKFSFCTD